MIKFLTDEDFVNENLPMAGVFEIPQSMPIGQAISELSLIIGGSLQDEWQNQVRFLPLQ